MKKNSTKKFSSLILLITSPILISFFLKLFLNFSFLASLTVCYGALLFFLIPSDVFSRSSLDYTIKAVNPTYKQEQPNFKNTQNNNLIHFFIITIVFIASLVALLINY